MTTGAEPPRVLRSTVDPDCDCVLVDLDAARASVPHESDTPPGTGKAEADAGGHREEARAAGEPLCPPGYVPRQHPRSPYDLHGKQVLTNDPPRQNPESRQHIEGAPDVSGSGGAALRD